jgi:autotransporter-associated beta strand protein
MAGCNSGGIGSRFNLKVRLSLGTALALGAWSIAAPAQAACTDTAPVNDETVTCSGSSTTGVIADTATGVTVNFDPAASLIPPTGQAVNLGAGAHITVGAGSTVGNNVNENTYSIRIGDGSSVTVDGLIQGRGGITGPGTDASNNFDGFSNATIIVNQGGEVNTNGLALLAAINGRGGGNTYTINGTVRDLNQGSGIMVGNNDVLNLGATGQLISVTGNSANPVYGSGKTGVTVTTAAGSLIELHGLGLGIQIGADADVTLGGLIRSYGDAYPNANSAGGTGVQVGANSTVTLLEGAQIITGNTMGLSNQGAGGVGIQTFSSSGPSNSVVVVDGLIDTQRALGLFSGIGDDITVGATGRITTRSTSYAILGNIWTSTTDYTWDLDISGTVEQLGNARAIFVTGSRQTGEVVETAAQVNITVEAGGTLYAAANLAYGQDDGFSTYPEIIDNFIVAGTVARGTPGTVIDLNDGADRITFLPTYSLTGNFSGGSDAGGPSNPTETDTFALDGAALTSATFNFGANQISNFEAGEKLGLGTWTLTGTTAGLNGLFSVQAGKLIVDGTLTNTGALVASGATLGGSGAFGGTATIANGGILLGTAGADLGFGSLVLNDSSLVQVALGAPSTNALFTVSGALTLDGRLGITDAGGFGLGTYRLIDYGGALTDNGLVIQSAPAGFNPGDWSLDLGTANQVNLVVAQGAGAQYWDGPNMASGGVANGRGGSGVWNSANSNWTNQPGNINAAWAGGIAIFNPAAGVSTVEVVGEQEVDGMQFLTPGGGDAQGYVFSPGTDAAIAIAAAQTKFDVAGDSGGAVIEASVGVEINGAGGMLKTGDGDLALTAANTYAGATRVEAGQLIAGATGALSGGPVTVAAGTRAFSGAGTSAGALQIENLTGGQTDFLTGTSAGSAAITNNSAGVTTFTIDATAADATIVNNDGGTTQFFGTSTGGDATITNNDGGTLFITQSATAQDTKIINNAGGTLDISSDAFQASAGVRLDRLSGAGDIFLGNRILTLGGLNGGLTLAGILADGGAAGGTGGGLTKIGTGTLILTGTNSYTGATTVNGGTLLVHGSIAGSAVTVNSGATLGGTGTVGSTTIASGGTLSPGASIGTLTVSGNLVFNPGSIFHVEIGDSSNDRVNVTGTASLNGAVAAFASNSVFTAGTYTLLNAVGGINGTFSPLTTTPNALAQLNYDSNNVFLTIDAGPENTFAMSTRDALVFNPATVTTNHVDAYSTQIIGRLLGGQPLYDQTFAAAYADPSVKAGVVAARAAITTAGGPGVIIGDPVRISSTTTRTTTSSTAYSLAGPGVTTVDTVTTFGPATIQIGTLTTCNVGSLPSATRPSCSSGGTSYNVGDDETNFNTITTTTYTIDETRIDTVTDTLRETWELTGQVVAVGTVHAEVQSGLFDLGGGFLRRLSAPRRANSGWAEGYGFRVRQGGARDALGLAGGVTLGLAPGVTLALGIDHANLDLDVPGTLETGDVGLTGGGAALRIDSGGFSAVLAGSYGEGHAETLRTLFGSSAARYDVRVAGAALDIGYGFETGGWTVRPVAGLDYVSLHTDGFSENGTLGLVAAVQQPHRWRGTAGLELARRWEGFELAASARYLTVLSGSERTLPVAFALAPARVLAMSAPSEPDAALIGARAGIDLSPNATLSFGYEGRFGGGYTGHSGVVALTIGW